ncbi:MAG: hypothetical protein CMN03_11110 [Roseibacillus sp.]|nr:hypothetical protein [Roseibacillus sp.]
MTSDRYLCPTCGGEVRVGRACSGCGPGRRSRKRKKGERTRVRQRSWEQDETHDGLGLPDEDFNYEEFVAREFGRGTGSGVIRIKWYWWVTAVVMTAILVGLIAGGLW